MGSARERRAFLHSEAVDGKRSSAASLTPFERTSCVGGTGSRGA